MMIRFVRVLIATLLCALALLAGAGHAKAAGNQDNGAAAVNTRDGSSIFRLAFAVKRVTDGTVVDATNEAVAYSSCTGCRSVAIAIEVVLVENDPSVITPQNLAVSLNYQCSLCDSFAFAAQFVVSTGGPVRFTPEGLRQLRDLVKQLHDLRKEDLSDAQLDARLKTITASIGEVLSHDLVPDTSGGQSPEEFPDASESASPSTSPSESGATTVPPVGSATPSVSESVSPTATAATTP
jgi:putative peptide zinc metalloprotease protein